MQRTPTQVIAELNREIAAASAAPPVQVQLAATGAQAAVTPPAAFAPIVIVRGERGSCGKLILKLQLNPD